jgi:hypothetical protein
MGALSLGVKWQGHEADHKLPSSAEIKNGGGIPPLSMRLHSVVLNQLSKGTTLPLPFQYVILTRKFKVLTPVITGIVSSAISCMIW